MDSLTNTRTRTVYPSFIETYRWPRPPRIDPFGLGRRLEHLGSAALGVVAIPQISSALAHGQLSVAGQHRLDWIGGLLAQREWSSES